MRRQAQSTADSAPRSGKRTLAQATFVFPSRHPNGCGECRSANAADVVGGEGLERVGSAVEFEGVVDTYLPNELHAKPTGIVLVGLNTLLDGRIFGPLRRPEGASMRRGGGMTGRTRLGLTGLLVLVIAGFAAIPAATVPHDNTRVPFQVIEHASQGVVMNYWAANPEQAPSRIRQVMEDIDNAPDRTNSSNSNFCASNANRDTFNCDVFGLPQNEESISACPTNDNLVLGGTNDYRGLIDPEGNFTGWHWSVDGGHSIQNEGLLPPARLVRTTGREVPSGGDPVKFIPAPCDAVFAASLAYDPANPFGEANGIAVYRSTPEILSTCQSFLPDGSTNPACWPQRRIVAESATQFLDKEWMFVGTQNGIRYVWVTYTAFDFANPAFEFTAEIHAVRCTDDLAECTEPIPISEANGPDLDVQFSDVTVGPDGRAYVTWSEIVGELSNDPDCPDPTAGCDQTFIHKIRVETAPGSAVFGPEQRIYEETRAIPFGGFVHANDFRVATYPKNDVVRLKDGTLRKFLIWDACKARALGSVCEEPEIKLSWSDDPAAAIWTPPLVISNGGDNYFPTISADRAGGEGLAAAWFTNYHDNDFHNRQDVVAVSIDSLTGKPRGHKRVTVSSNEPEADPLLGGAFIGDYIEGVLVRNRFLVHWNGNYRKVPLLFGLLHPEGQEASPLNQQDNYLTITAFASN